MNILYSYGPPFIIAMMGIILLVAGGTGGGFSLLWLPVPELSKTPRIVSSLLGLVLMAIGGTLGFISWTGPVPQVGAQQVPTMVMPTMDMSNYVTKSPPTMDMKDYLSKADAQATLAASMIVVSGSSAGSTNAMPTDTVQAAATQKVTADTSTWPQGFAETVGTHLTYATQIVLTNPDKYGYWQQDYNKLKAIEGQHPEYKDFIEYILQLGWTY
jgi:hypothetical protein